MSEPITWKHIGLHGFAVGTLALTKESLLWKSAVSGRDDEAASTRKINASKLRAAAWTVFGKTASLRLSTSDPKQHEWRLDGFPVADRDALAAAVSSLYDVELQTLPISSAGTQYGITKIKGKLLVLNHCTLQDDLNEEGQEFEVAVGDQICSLDLTEVSQCVLPGNNRNELELQFPETDTMEAGTDQLVAIRMYIPPDPDFDPTDKEANTAAELLQQQIMATANIRSTTGDVLVSFEQHKGAFLTPRGRYGIELYDTFLRMRGQKYDYKIRYDDINRLFLLPKPDEVHMAFVIALDKPIRQGQQRYQYLVMQASKEPDEVVVNMDEAALESEYKGELQPVMRGSLSNLIAKTFKVIANKKVFIPGKFANANQQASLSCSVRANEGLLYPLEKQFVFIHKPPIIVRFNEIESVEFQRYAGGQGSTRNFDLCVNLQASSAAAGVKDYTFSGIDRSDYAGLYSFLSGKKIPIKNLQEGFTMDDPAERAAPVYNEDEIFGPSGGGGGGDDDEESDDESYGGADAAKDEAPGSDDDDEDEEDDDDLGSEVDDDEEDSVMEEARTKKSKSSETKKSKKRPAEEDDDEDDDDDEDESPKKKKKVSAAAPTKKKKKDANAPKRAMTAYFMFMNENRNRIKEENPDAAFPDIAKIAGVEWKNMSADDKEKYEKMAATDKQRYQTEMKDYTPPEGMSPGKGKKGAAASPKKKKDPNAPKKAMSAFMYFSSEARKKIKEENPALSFGEIGKKSGELYRALSADEKKKYEDMAKKDKERYKTAQAEFEKSKQNADDGVDEDDDEDDDDKNDDSDDDDDE